MQYQKVDFTKSFIKQFKALNEKQKQRFYDRLELFKNNPFDKTLRNHALKGKKYKGHRSIDIASDLRALYYVKGDRVVIFAFIGTHSQLY